MGNQDRTKTGRSTGKGGGSARSRLPFGFAQQRRTTLRKDPLLPQRLSDGSSGSSSDRRHRYGEVRNNEQTKKTDRLVPVRNSVAATLSGDYSAASAGAGSVQGAAAQESHFSESGQSTHSAGTNSAAASAASSAAAGLFALPAHDTIAAAATTTINV